MTSQAGFGSYFMPTIKDARMLHFASAALGGALSSFLSGRYFTHLTAGQSLGYGLSGLSASALFGQFHWIGVIAGPPAVEFLGEGVISASLNLREIAVVVVAGYVGMVCTIHALNLASKVYQWYFPSSSRDA